MSFQFGDKVTFLGAKAIFLYEDSGSAFVIHSDISNSSCTKIIKLTAGWPPEPEVYEQNDAMVHERDDGSLTCYVYVPSSFYGKTVNFRIEEVLK